MESLGINYHAILPETITASVAVLIMMIDALARKIERRVAGAVSLIGLIGAGVAVVSLFGRNGETSFKGMIITDGFRLFFAMIFLVVTFLTVLISLRWVEDEVLPTGEYFALLMFATTGMLFMSAANDLVMIFLGLEITSISTYVLCGYRRNDLRSNESAMKYFILGSFSTAFLPLRNSVRLRRQLQSRRPSRSHYKPAIIEGSDRGGSFSRSRCCWQGRR